MAEVAAFSALLYRAPDLTPLAMPRDDFAADHQKWLADGTLARDPTPAVYRYHQTFEQRGRSVTRKGLIARVRLAPPAERIIRPHQRTPPAVVAARLAAMKTARARFTPPFGLYEDRQHRVDELFEFTELHKPDVSGETPDGVMHRLWRLTDEEKLARLVSILSVEPIYLAAGHAEYAAMLAWRDETPDLPENSPLHWGALYLCNLDDPGLVVLPTHRVLFGLPAPLDRANLLQRAREFFVVTEGPLSGPDAVRPALAGQAKRGPAFAVITPGLDKIAYLRLRPDLIKASVPALAESRALGELDLTYLHALIFTEILGLDAAAEQRHLRYVRDIEAAFAELAAPGVQALFLMNPARLDLMRAVVDEERFMPDHATWFHPPVPGGLVVDAII